MYYDTCYAMMDRKDDIKAGVNSTAVLFGNGSRARIILSFFALGLVSALTCFGVWSHQRLPYFIYSVGGTALHLLWQVATIDFNDVKSCMKRFLSNGAQLGFIVLSGLLVNYAMILREDQALSF